MANRWENKGNNDRLYFLRLQNHCRWWLLFGRKVMTNLDSTLKSRDITLPTMIRLVKTMVFPVVIYGCESWTIKKAEHWRTDAFELWCWRRVLRVPWTARRSNQSIPKEINPEYSLEGLMLRLKLQYFGHLVRRTDLLEKTLIAGKDWRQEEKGMTEDEMVGWYHQHSGHEFEQTLEQGRGRTGKPGVLLIHGISMSWSWHQVHKILELQLQHQFAVQGTLKSLLQHYNLEASILWRSTFLMVQFSRPYMTTGKTIVLTIWTSVGKVMSLLP